MTDFQHPLIWPKDVAKTAKSRRIRGRFEVRKSAVGQGRGKKGVILPISMPDALERLVNAISAVSGYGATITTNMPVTRHGALIMADEGSEKINMLAVGVLFYVSRTEYLVGCDRYKRVADNIAGVADYLSMVKRMSCMGCGAPMKVLEGFRI